MPAASSSCDRNSDLPLDLPQEFGQLNETGIHVLNQRPGYPPSYSGVGYSEVFFSRLEGPRGHLRKDFSPHTPCYS
eukprot:SAG31_NODE_10532_length_1127_cov_1.670233_1_plen_75_part_10